MDVEQIGIYVIDSVEASETTTNPYYPSFAGGNSGLSYGRMQNDILNNPQALAYFDKILSKAGMTSSEISQIVTVGQTPGLSTAEAKSELGPSLWNKLQQALSDDKSDVDAIDAITAHKVLYTYFIDQGLIGGAYLNSSGPGALNPVAPDPYFVTEVADWGNRATPPGLQQTGSFLATTANVVTLNYYNDYYLSKTDYFTKEAGTDNSLPEWQKRVLDPAAVITLGKIGATASAVKAGQAVLSSDTKSAANDLAFWKNQSGNLVGQFWGFSSLASTDQPTGSLVVWDQDHVAASLAQGSWDNVKAEPSGTIAISLAKGPEASGDIDVIYHLGNDAALYDGAAEVASVNNYALDIGSNTISAPDLILSASQQSLGDDFNESEAIAGVAGEQSLVVVTNSSLKNG